MRNFSQEFHTLQYVMQKSESVLLFTHKHPDSDTIGSALAFKEYLKTLGIKKIDVACYDPLPEYLKDLTNESLEFPAHLDLTNYKLVIACDAVERGFEKIQSLLKPDQVTALIDHHLGVKIKGDINILDADYSSVCEIIYDFFQFNRIFINKKMAAWMLLGILFDTGMFKHANTTHKVMKIASDLMKKGVNLPKIAETVFANKKFCTLKLWGRALEKARINQLNGMISSVVTIKDIDECQAGIEDIARISEILNTVPGTKFSLVLSEREGGFIKGSLRSEEDCGVDVSQIAAQFGGGGHKLASGFEIKGRIVESSDGWKIE